MIYKQQIKQAFTMSFCFFCKCVCLCIHIQRVVERKKEGREEGKESEQDLGADNHCEWCKLQLKQEIRKSSFSYSHYPLGFLFSIQTHSVRQRTRKTQRMNRSYGYNNKAITYIFTHVYLHRHTYTNVYYIRRASARYMRNATDTTGGHIHINTHCMGFYLSYYLIYY